MTKRLDTHGYPIIRRDANGIGADDRNTRHGACQRCDHDEVPTGDVDFRGRPITVDDYDYRPDGPTGWYAPGQICLRCFGTGRDPGSPDIYNWTHAGFPFPMDPEGNQYPLLPAPTVWHPMWAPRLARPLSAADASRQVARNGFEELARLYATPTAKTELPEPEPVAPPAAPASATLTPIDEIRAALLVATDPDDVVYLSRVLARMLSE